eukprot:s465_g17.t2
MRMVLERPEVIYAMCTNTYGNYVRLLLGARRLVLLQPPRFSKGASTVASAPKAPGTGMAAYILRTGLRGMRGVCTVTGGVGLTVFGLVICPYVSSRIVAFDSSRELLMASELLTAVREMRMPPVRKFKALGELEDNGKSRILAAPGRCQNVACRLAFLLPSCTSAFLLFTRRKFSRGFLHRSPYISTLLEVSFHDLQRPFFFRLFEWVGRFTFACYSDASGVMTLDEFKCAVHKMIDARKHWDLVLEAHSLSQGKAAAPAEARAQAVRELTKHVVPAVFRVLDFDQNGSIGAFEFIRGALLLLATVQGAPLDTPQLADLAFRVVDADADGLVTSAELLRWVTLALEHGVTSADVLREPRGPFGWFGTRILTPAQLAKRWLAEADFDRDGKLLPQEFAVLAPRLRIHQTICRMAGWAGRFNVSCSRLRYVQKMLENTRGEEWPTLCQAIRNVESQLNSTGGAAGGREDPREVFKHILTHLNKDESVGRKSMQQVRQGRSSDVRSGCQISGSATKGSLRCAILFRVRTGFACWCTDLTERGGHFGKGQLSEILCMQARCLSGMEPSGPVPFMSKHLSVSRRLQGHLRDEVRIVHNEVMSLDARVALLEEQAALAPRFGGRGPAPLESEGLHEAVKPPVSLQACQSTKPASLPTDGGHSRLRSAFSMGSGEPRWGGIGGPRYGSEGAGVQHSGR